MRTDVFSYKGVPPTVVQTDELLSQVLTIFKQQNEILEKLARVVYLVPAGTQLTKVAEEQP